MCVPEAAQLAVRSADSKKMSPAQRSSPLGVRLTEPDLDAGAVMFVRIHGPLYRSFEVALAIGLRVHENDHHRLADPGRLFDTQQHGSTTESADYEAVQLFAIPGANHHVQRRQVRNIGGRCRRVGFLLVLGQIG